MPKMTRMIAVNPHVYAGRQISAGEEFDIEEQHVNIWVILGRARVKDPSPEEPTYSTRMLTARGRRGTRSIQ